jgi:hypothetical protein
VPDSEHPMDIDPSRDGVDPASLVAAEKEAL